MNTTNIKVGKKIRKCRRITGLTQERLAELIKRDVRTVVAVETGKRNPTLLTLKKIATALKVKLSDLID
jgi:transcriptional regulator with XRE-family HTH domain